MKHFRRFRSIRQKTILAMVWVGLLPVILSLFITYVEERRALRETIGSNFKGMATEVARKVETQIIRGINEAQQLATIPFIRGAVIDANRSYEGRDAHEIKSYIEEWKNAWRTRKHPDEFPAFVNQIATNYLIDWHAIRKADYLAILVTDQQGALVLTSLPQVKFFHGDSEWWLATFRNGAGKPYVSDLFFDPSFGTHVVNVAVPIVDDRHNRAIGTISVLLRRDSLFRSISEVTAGVTGHAMLMASDGTPLLCPVLALEQHAIWPPMVQAMTQNQSGWVEAERDSHGSEHSIVGYAHLRVGTDLAPESFGGRSWVMFVRQDPEESFAPLRQLLIKFTAYGAVLFAVLWGAGMIVGRKIVQPIQSLHEGAQRIGSGNLDQPLKIHTGDEVEDLAIAFNRMAVNLKQSFAQLNEQMSEIRSLEAKYRDLIEHSPEMIHQLDKSGRFVHVNKTELDKLGYRLDEMLAMHLWDIVPAECKQEIVTHVENLPSRKHTRIETVFLTKDGEPIDVEIHSTVLLHPETGDVVYTRAFIRDVTERKVLQQQVERYTTRLESEVQEQTKQLSQSERRYRVLFNRAADSILMVNDQGMITAVNEREQELLGYAETDLVSKSLESLIASPYRSSAAQLFQQVLQGDEKIPTAEIQVFDIHQKARPVEMDLVRVSNGPAPQVMVQLRDITARKQLEEHLQKYNEELERKVIERTREIQETKQYLESLLENANDVIYTLDSDQCFTYVNSKVEIWGYRKEDLIGRPYLTLLSKRHRGRRLKDILNIQAKHEYEVEFLTQQGEARSVLVSVSPLESEQGAMLGVLGIARDITDRKHLEHQIRNAERLASVGKLAAGVAHEINNPLGGILNCLYNIRKGSLPPARQEEYLIYMEDGLRRAQKIVRQLLDFSQQHEPELASSDINSIAERVLVLTNHAFVERQLRLTREYGNDLPSLLVDPHMIEQVLMNLILNAIQATSEGGMITIRTRQVADHCEIDVVDTGTGIAPEVRPHIFDPFYTTKRTGEGTGLGLSVSLGIVERHGGQLLVESEVGKGTTFTVQLPISAHRLSPTRVS